MIPLIGELVVAFTFCAGGLWLLMAAYDRSQLHRTVRWAGFAAGFVTCSTGCLWLADAYYLALVAVGR